MERPRIAGSLGADWKKDLVWLDGGPTAAASIGQVHKGRWHDGRDVAVKVQYPGAGEALMSDLRQIARLGKTVAPLVPGVDVKPLIAEMQERTVEELDYTLEQLTDDTIVLVGRNDTATSTDTITVVPSPDSAGSRVTYEAVIELSGAAKIADPVMKIVFEKIGSDTEDDMTTVLNRLA